MITMKHSQGKFTDFSKSPFLAIWETTHACDLACVHCRAEADPNPSPDELTRAEGLGLINQIHALGTPIVIFSGGDPLKRSDLPELIAHAKKLGLRTGAIPAVTPILTREKMRLLKDSGLDQIALSLDASDAATHDAFRKTDGVFDRTRRCIEWAHETGLALQINSLVNLHNSGSLDNLIRMIEDAGIVFWEVFFLVPVGRGKELSLLSAEKFESAFEQLHALQQQVDFVIKVTEAPHYRRFRIEQEIKRRGLNLREVLRQKQPLADFLISSAGVRPMIGRVPPGINAGKGFIFVSHQGEVLPSGFLPLSAGNVRVKNLAEIYRKSPFLKQLRDPSLLKGRCGKCFYKELCGGSRSRAYALTGDYLEEDPACIFDPETFGETPNPDASELPAVCPGK